jgi:hypothetical protein
MSRVAFTLGVAVALGLQHCQMGVLALVPWAMRL